MVCDFLGISKNYQFPTSYANKVLRVEFHGFLDILVSWFTMRLGVSGMA